MNLKDFKKWVLNDYGGEGCHLVQQVKLVLVLPACQGALA